jgi:NADH-quinone oxidoreductase subunit N
VSNAIDSSTIMLLLPEILLVLLAVCIYVGGAFSDVRAGWAGLAIVTLFLAAFALYRQDTSLWAEHAVLAESAGAQFASGGMLFDSLSHSFRWVGLLLGILLVLAYLPMQRSELFTEGLGSVVFIVVGMMVVALAGDLITMFLGLELISIPTYILLFLGKNDKGSAESATKYFFLSILSSALLLYGFSMLYGLAGTTDLVEMRIALSADWTDNGLGALPLLPLTVVFLLAGFGFKIAAVPFHFYAPDVYQATTNTNAGLLSAAPKIVGSVAMIRLFVGTIPVESDIAWQLVVVLSIATMVIGNCAALWQKNIRRMLAYSSIANAGYLLIGLAAAMASVKHGGSAADGVAGVIVHVVLYSVAAFGTFCALAYLDDSETDFSEVRQLAGFGARHPLVAGVLAVCLFSLSGIPPLAGFWGKFLLFKSAITTASIQTEIESGVLVSATGNWFWVLAVIAAINAAIAAAYYLRVVSTMYFQEAEPLEHPRYLPAGTFGPGLSAILCALLALLCVFPGRLVDGAYKAAEVTVSPQLVGTGPVDNDSKWAATEIPQ